MKKHTARKRRKYRDSSIRQYVIRVFLISYLVLWASMGALIAGCAFGNYHFQSSLEISRQFENGEIVSGYRYYVSGPDIKPLAIVAIRTDYHLQSEHWRGIDVDNPSLKAMVELVSQVMGSEYKEDQVIPNGARIITPDGEMVGMWYSVYDYSSVTFLDDKVILISKVMTILPYEFRTPRY